MTYGIYLLFRRDLQRETLSILHYSAGNDTGWKGSLERSMELSRVKYRQAWVHSAFSLHALGIVLAIFDG
jgi:hypothetical protein